MGNSWNELITEEIIEEFLRVSQINFQKIKFVFEKNKITTYFESEMPTINVFQSQIDKKRFICNPTSAILEDDKIKYLNPMDHKLTWLAFLNKKFQGIKIKGQTYSEKVLSEFENKVELEKTNFKKIATLKNSARRGMPGVTEHFKRIEKQREILKKVLGIKQTDLTK